MFCICSSANTLEAHKRLHLGIRPYKCDICGKSYSQSGNLAYHKSTHAGVKSHVCHLCGKAFLTAGILANHERRHAGLKPYVCDQCGRAFADNYTLTHHKVCYSCFQELIHNFMRHIFIYRCFSTWILVGCEILTSDVSTYLTVVWCFKSLCS
jgi:uncharacterized Zn-finger protein